jgi:hypothetical protein
MSSSVPLVPTRTTPAAKAITNATGAITSSTRFFIAWRVLEVRFEGEAGIYLLSA